MRSSVARSTKGDSATTATARAGARPRLGRAWALFAWTAAAFAAATVAGGCSRNLLSEFGNKNSDEALLFDAKAKMDARDWTGAIASFQAMSSSALANRDVKAAYASAYAGRCGLDMVSLVQKLSSSNANLFVTLMKHFQGATIARASDCVQARALLSSISASASGRTPDENTLMAFVALTDVGVRLAASADANGDGAVDGGWDSCSSSPFGPPAAAPGATSDASARQVGVDFTTLVDSLSAPGMPSLLGTVQSQLGTLCSAMYSWSSTYAICGGSSLNFDPTAWTQNQVKLIDGLVRTNSFPGLGVATGGFPADVCP